MAITVETLQVAVEQTGADKAASSMKKLAIAAGGAVAAYKLTTKAIKAATQAWEVQEKAEIRLASALKASGQEITGNTILVQKFTSALQQQTNIGDEVTIGLVATATAMGATSQEAMAATEAAVGLSEALGLGLDASLKAVINAQEGNYQQLQRYIPALKGVTDESEAWDIINTSVASGLTSLEAQTKTMTGQMTRLTNAWGDYIEQVGRSMTQNPSGFLSRVAGAIENVTGKTTQHNDAMEIWNELTRKQQRDLGGLSGFLVDYQQNLALTEYWTARLAATNKAALGEDSPVWKADKSREFWAEYTAGIIKANTHMSELERIEFNRAEALKSANTEYADFNLLIEEQINKYYDIEAARVKANQALEQEAIKTRELEELNRAIAESQREREQLALEAHNTRMAQIAAEQQATMTMYNTLKGIVQQYYANEIAAAGDNEEQLQEIREKQFKANQAFAIADTIINTSQAIMKVLAQGGIFAIPLSVAMGALGAAQIAMIASAKPSFATGTPAGGYVVPPGYEGDNYPVMAKSGETVNISRTGEGGAGMAQISIILDSSVIARVTTNLIENRQIVIRQSDVVGL